MRKTRWKGSGITNAIHETRTQQVNVINLNPFTKCIEIILSDLSNNGSLKNFE